MYLFGGLKSRDKELAIEISKFFLRQLHAAGNSKEYEENWKNRIISSYTYGYYLGFCVDASCKSLSSTNNRPMSGIMLRD